MESDAQRCLRLSTRNASFGPPSGRQDPMVLPSPPVTLTDLPLTATPTWQAALPDGSDPLHGALVELAASLDAREIETKTLNFARAILRADRVSAWRRWGRGGAFTCWVASGDGAERVTGASGPLDALDRPMEHEDGMTVIVAPLRPTAAATSGALRVARDLAAHGAFTPGERVALTRLAEVAGVALRNAERMAANDRTGDLELVMEMSRAIGSTLDLDRVMRAVVNLAMRAISFDRGAIALYERGKCDIRALAGVEKFDAEDPELQDLAVRGAWAAGVGEAFYLSDRTEAGSDAERLFLQIFEGDLEADGVVSGLYIPLKDDEGVLGILLFEAERPEFATERQRELATILANQATVALRNAQLYQQVPLADTLGAIHAKKEAFLALPRDAPSHVGGDRRGGDRVADAHSMAAAGRGEPACFRPNVRTEIRPLVDGVVERVFIGEGARVARGDPIVQLRDAEQRTSRDAALSDAASAEREATASVGARRCRGGAVATDACRRAAARSECARRASSRGARAQSGRGYRADAEAAGATGLVGDAGSQLIVVGRTDTLELDFNVDERDIGRVQVGDEVRLRVDAYPQRTFVGRVTVIGVDRWTGGPVDRSNGEDDVGEHGAAGFPARALFRTIPVSFGPEWSPMRVC